MGPVARRGALLARLLPIVGAAGLAALLSADCGARSTLSIEPAAREGAGGASVSSSGDGGAGGCPGHPVLSGAAGVGVGGALLDGGAPNKVWEGMACVVLPPEFPLDGGACPSVSVAKPGLAAQFATPCWSLLEVVSGPFARCSSGSFSPPQGIECCYQVIAQLMPC